MPYMPAPTAFVAKEPLSATRFPPPPPVPPVLDPWVDGAPFSAILLPLPAPPLIFPAALAMLLTLFSTR